MDIADKLKCPLLCLYGGKDTGIALGRCAGGGGKGQGGHKTVEVVIYPESPHGFHADYRPSYRKADAEDGWKRVIAWFRRYGLVPKGATQGV